MRLFVAVDPGERLRDVLATRLDTWREHLDLKWVRPENLHVTLRFLGQWPAADLDGLCGVLQGVARHGRAFDLRPGGLGVFPNWRRPRVLFLQLEGNGELERLAALVGDALEARFPDKVRKTQPFRAHLTLARFRDPPTREGIEALRTLVPPAPDPFPVRDFRLIGSRLTRQGPIYAESMVFPLAGDSSA